MKAPKHTNDPTSATEPITMRDSKGRFLKKHPPKGLRSWLKDNEKRGRKLRNTP